jgi:phosphoglycerate dehydrogenase-like enzyme
MQTSILVIDEHYADHYRDRIREKFPQVRVHTALVKETVGEEVREVDAIWGIGTQRIFGEEIVGRAERLRWIQAFTTGTDGILALASLKKDVVVTSMRGIHGPQMSEHAFLFMIGLARDFPRILRNQAKAAWDRFDQTRVFGKTVAILGVGIIGADLAARAKACGMRVIGITRTPRAVENFDDMVTYGELERAARAADFLVVIAPYSAQTAGIVNAKVLAAMKPSAFVINISRGGVCDEDALLEALREKRIAGAGLDVFETEPLPADHPFWRMHNVMVTPHMGGSSDFAPGLQMEILEHNLRCFLESRPADMVNIVRAGSAA